MEQKSNIILKKIKLKKKNPKRMISLENKKLKQIRLVKQPIKRTFHRPTSAFAYKNINNIVHLYKNNKNAKVDILWTLNLRQSDFSSDLNNEKYKKNRELMNQVKEPSFYQEDLEKYVKKRMKKSKSSNEVNLPSLHNYSYLFKNKLTETHGTILNNKDLLKFELNLRTSNYNNNSNKKNEKENINNKKINAKNEIKKIKWDNNIHRDIKKDLYTVNYNKNMNLTNDKLKKNWLEEKLVMRPYKVVFKKVRYDDNSDIIKKNYIKDKDIAYNKLGDIYSYKPYNDKYNEKNYNNIENLLNGNNKSQQNIWFQLSLRQDLNKKSFHK